MNHRHAFSCLTILVTLGLTLLAWRGRDRSSTAQEPSVPTPAATTDDHPERFQQFARPFVQQYCERCHNADTMKSGVRLDQLSATPEDKQLFLLKNLLQQVGDEAMPPDDELQPSDLERTRFVEWIQETMAAAIAQPTAQWIGPAANRVAVPQHAARFAEA